VRIPWYDRLTRDPATIWLALLLYPHASNSARTRAEQLAEQARRLAEQRAEAAFRNWSRQQNRSAALGWAVAGICLMAALWFLIITVSDLVQSVSNAAITLAWVGTSVCLPVALTAECLLAGEIGARFHPRYSMPGAGVIALRPIGRWMQGSPLPAAGAILLAAAGTGLLAVNFPLLLVAVTTAGQLGWVLRRLRAWRVQLRIEDAQIAAAG
jgi:hypothetical protein